MDEYIDEFVKQGKFEKQHHCLAKRLGDQGQALSCLKETITLKHKSADNNIIQIDFRDE